MPHPLEQQLARLRRRARIYVVLKAASRALLWIVATALLLALVDRLFRVQDRGLRAIFSLVLLSVAAIQLRRIWQAVRRSRYQDVQVAQRVEQVYPQLQGLLASAVEFVRQGDDDVLAGSAVLRRAVVRDATSQMERLDLSRSLDPGPARRAMSLAGVVLAACAALSIFEPATARIGAVRLVNPLSDLQWPRANRLVILAPVERLPRGQTFEVQVVDAADEPLPDDLTIRYRYHNPNGEVLEETEPVQRIDRAALARREVVERPFEYRVTGGDDYTMPWLQLDIVEPPMLRDSAVTLRFPEYTGWAPRAGELQLRTLVGTAVQIQGTATKPLASVAAHLSEDVSIPATVSADGYDFSLPTEAGPEFTVTRSGSYWFELLDREGFHGDRTAKYEVQAVLDAAPTIEIESPKANIFVTNEASFPLALAARDDLALRRITLDYLRSDKSDEGEQSLELGSGPEQVSSEIAQASASEDYTGDVRQVTYQWHLAPLALPPGTQVTFHAAAVDYAGQSGHSLPHRLTVVSAEEIQDRMAERQSLIFNELARVLELQQSARSHVSGLEVQLDQTGRLKNSDVDILQGAALNQQQVERELSGEQDGLGGQIADFLDELKINKIDGPDTHRTMQDILDELARLADEPLPAAARELTAASKAAQVEMQNAPDDSRNGTAVRAALENAGAAQDQVAAALARLMDNMRQWVNYRHFHREISQLTKGQEELATQTAELGQQTLSRAVEDLPAQQRADLRKLADRELELARRLDRFEQRLEQAAVSARQDDPLVADAMSDALSHARSHGLANTMRQSGQDVAGNRIGQASQAQQRMADELRELQDILSNRREHELGRLVKKLRQAEEQLTKLAEQQKGLRKKLQDAAQLSEQERRQQLERLTREQRDLEQEAARLARALERLQADKAGTSAARAGGKMGQAATSGSSGDGGGAADQAAKAEQDLAQAQQELAQARRQAEMDLAQEQLARMEDAMTSMRDREQALVGETVHYQQRQADRGHLTRAEAASVRDMAAQQTGLRDETQELAKSLSGAEVFQFVLDATGRHMTRAAQRLERREVDDETVRAETAALARIEQLIEALNSQAEPPGESGDQDAGGGEGGGGGQQPQIRSVAELRLLKSIQQQINDRIQALDEARRGITQLTEDQQAELAELSREQGRLADLVTNMMVAEEERPEDNPDALPDLRELPQDDAGSNLPGKEKP